MRDVSENIHRRSRTICQGGRSPCTPEALQISRQIACASSSRGISTSRSPLLMVIDSRCGNANSHSTSPPTTPISALSGGERQAVAIARAMHFESDLIILDEPTNNLGVEETQSVLRFVRSARDSGHSCIFIAHNIYHVFQVVDRIIVLRRGKKVADDIDPKQTTIEAVERLITGMTPTPP